MENPEKNPGNSNQDSKNVKKSGQPVWLILALLFAGLAIVEAWFLFNQNKQIQVVVSENVDLTREKEEVEAELKEMLQQYENLKTDNAQMQAQLEEQKQKIEELLKQAEKHKNDAYIIAKLKKETETLRRIMQGYVRTIDSLNTVNKKLKEEKEMVSQALEQEKSKSQMLEKTKEELSQKVTVASYLKAVNIKAFGVKVKNDNTGKELNRAKRIDKIRVCFTIAENKVTEPGTKYLYLRILTPDGKVLPYQNDESNLFTFNGVKGIFSDRKSINYQNEETEACLDWAKPNDDYEFLPGEYVLEIYCDGVDIGRTKLTLK
ncbi:MAG: hypothetical protein KatS3mg034_0175 [Vicingaceae bacterium]|nr:MAG: hypothetical protein KatS3mg034_0175 [Vicingaceae bacterium]